MSVTVSDILIKLSVRGRPPGGSYNGSPSASLGGWISSTEADASTNSLFGLMTADENATDFARYRCIFVHNANQTNTLHNIKVWLAGGGGSDIAIGLDPYGMSNAGTFGQQAVETSRDSEPPLGVVFITPTSKENAMVMGDLGPNRCCALWLRRRGTNILPNLSGAWLTIEGVNF